MKKLFLTSALALAVTAGATVPAHAGESMSFNFEEIRFERNHTQNVEPASGGLNIIAILIGLLLPAIQK